MFTDFIALVMLIIVIMLSVRIKNCMKYIEKVDKRLKDAENILLIFSEMFLGVINLNKDKEHTNENNSNG